MSEPHRPRRGLPIPAIGTCAAIAAAVGAGLAVWSQFGTPTPDVVARPAPNRAMMRLQNVEALVLEGRDGVPDLVAMLGDPDPRARRDALFGLGRLGPEAADEIEAVRALLVDDSAAVRSSALSAFRRLSREPETIVATIGPLLADADENVRQNAKEMLIAAWRDELQTLRNAGGGDGQGMPDLGTTAALMALLKSERPAVRSGTLSVLTQLDVQNSAVEAVARDLLDDPNAEVRDRAFSLLVALDMATFAELRLALRREFPLEQAAYPPAGPIRDLVGQYYGVVHPAIPAIARRGTAAAELVPDLALVFARLDVLEYKHQWDPISQRAVEFDLDAHVDGILKALRAMKVEARSAAPDLLERIDEVHNFGRIQFSQTLAEIGAEPDAISAILVPIISEEKPVDPADRNAVEARQLDLWEAGKLLVQVDPQEARRQVSLTIPRLGGGKAPINKMALFAIYGLAPEAREAQSRIEPLQKHPDAQISAIAAQILNQLRR